MEHASHLFTATPRPGFGDLVARAAAWVETAMRVHRERRQLIALDGSALKDIGLSRADAYGEWSRPFWDLPHDR